MANSPPAPPSPPSTETSLGAANTSVCATENGLIRGRECSRLTDNQKLPAFPDVGGKTPHDVEADPLVELDGVFVGGGYRQARGMATQVAQGDQGSAKQGVANTRSAHRWRNADLGDVSAFRRHQAGERDSA